MVGAVGELRSTEVGGMEETLNDDEGRVPGDANTAALETARSTVWKSARSAISWRLSPTLMTPSMSSSVRRLVEEVELPTLVLLKSFRERLVEAGLCSSYHPVQ